MPHTPISRHAWTWSASSSGPEGPPTELGRIRARRHDRTPCAPSRKDVGKARAVAAGAADRVGHGAAHRRRWTKAHLETPKVVLVHVALGHGGEQAGVVAHAEALRPIGRHGGEHQILAGRHA